MKRLYWGNCDYGKKWGKALTKDALAHPAKFNRGPLERLADHGLKLGWWRRGDLIVDPMAGVGTAGLVFSACQIRWLGVEIDRRWVDESRKVFDAFRAETYFLRQPLPDVVHGDARQLAFIVDGEADAIVTSPPYAEMLHNPGGSRCKFKTGRSHFHNPDDAYGACEGQIGKLKAGEYAEAMLTVYGQCHDVLKPGGVLVVNVRNYVRKKKLVQLSRTTIGLLRRSGFVPVITIRCSMNGHASFFRRVNQQKGLPVSNYDHFLVFRRST